MASSEEAQQAAQVARHRLAAEEGLRRTADEQLMQVICHEHSLVQHVT